MPDDINPSLYQLSQRAISPDWQPQAPQVWPGRMPSRSVPVPGQVTPYLPFPQDWAFAMNRPEPLSEDWYQETFYGPEAGPIPQLSGVPMRPDPTQPPGSVEQRYAASPYERQQRVLEYEAANPWYDLGQRTSPYTGVPQTGTLHEQAGYSDVGPAVTQAQITALEHQAEQAGQHADLMNPEAWSAWLRGLTQPDFPDEQAWPNEPSDVAGPSSYWWAGGPQGPGWRPDQPPPDVPSAGSLMRRR